MPTAFDAKPAAQRLLEAMRSRARFTEFDTAAKPGDLKQGYDVQDAIAAEAAKSGDLAGWKLGIGSKNAMKGAGLRRPVVGRLFGSRLFDTTKPVPVPRGVPAMVEIEICFRLSRDVAPSDALDDPMEAVGDAHIVSELVISRFVDRVAAGLASFVADSVGFHALIIGQKIDKAAIGRIGSSAIVTIDREEKARAATGDDAIDPAIALGDLMAHARERGLTLRKGEWVTTGTLTKPFFQEPPARLKVEADGAALTFDIVPE